MEEAEWTGSGKLFQTEAVREWKKTLRLRWSWPLHGPQSDSFVWSQWMGSEWVMWQEWSEDNKLFSMTSFVGQQTDLELNSKFYWTDQ